MLKKSRDFELEVVLSGDIFYNKIIPWFLHKFLKSLSEIQIILKDLQGNTLRFLFTVLERWGNICIIMSLKMKDWKLVFQIPVFLFKDSLTVTLIDLQKKLSNLKSDIENHWETPTIQIKGIAITDNCGLIKLKKVRLTQLTLLEFCFYLFYELFCF